MYLSQKNTQNCPKVNTYHPTPIHTNARAARQTQSEKELLEKQQQEPQFVKMQIDECEIIVKNEAAPYAGEGPLDLAALGSPSSPDSTAILSTSAQKAPGSHTHSQVSAEPACADHRGASCTFVVQLQRVSDPLSPEALPRRLCPSWGSR